jgi:nucleoside phosphorylase
MKVLLVDDEYQKVEAISRISGSLGHIEIEHVSTAHAARARLRAASFDLLLLDLHLPGAVGSPPSAKGGIELFDLLVLDRQCGLPTSIACISAKDDLGPDILSQLASRGLQLISVVGNETTWLAALEGQLKLALARHDRKSLQADVVIVTALHDPELMAVLELPYQWRIHRAVGDPTTFHIGTVQQTNRTLTVVAASAHRKGMPSAAALATHMAHLFSPRYLLMLGICAGVRDKVGFGDIVIGDPTWDWGSGKLAEDAGNSPVFLASPFQMTVDPMLRQAILATIDNAEVIRSIKAGWQGKTPEGALKAHLGPMASGASVVADRSSPDRIKVQNRDVIAIEMEAYGVMAASEYLPQPPPKVAAIKSVCDFADPLKDDRWQKYAAYTSARFTAELLKSDLI